MAKVIPSVESVQVGTEDKKYSSRGYRFYALFLLTGVYVFSYIDRKVLFILQEPIKVEFGLSDTQLGLLTGFAFMAFYVVFGIPIARWADRSVRRDIIALAIGVASHCDACIGFHVKALIRLGVSREQLMETLAVCTYMGGGPSLMYAAEAVRAYEELSVGRPAPAHA